MSEPPECWTPAGPTGLSDQYGAASWRPRKMQLTRTVTVVLSGASSRASVWPTASRSWLAGCAGTQTGTGPRPRPAGQLPLSSEAWCASPGSEMIWASRCGPPGPADGRLR